MVERRLEQAAEEARSRPAKAGIQWFMKYIPALAGMTAKHTIPAGKQNRNPFYAPAPPSWIPAFAGMTMGCYFCFTLFRLGLPQAGES